MTLAVSSLTPLYSSLYFRYTGLNKLYILIVHMCRDRFWGDTTDDTTTI